MEAKEQKFSEFSIKISHEAKLKEILRNLNSIESQLFSDAAKEFIKVLKSDEGPEFIQSYIQTSSKLVEISQAWESRHGKPGFLHILNLVSAILKLWKENLGGEGGGGGAGRWLDKFARSLIEEKMGVLYKELNSKEAKRQNAVLYLLASIVLRNSHLAWEVAKVFDFKLAVFPKLAEVRLRVKKLDEGRRKIHSTRKAFVRFAMSFLEVGHPRLLRGILQQKEMYSGVLRGLGNDDEDTLVYVLSVLRDRVLVPESIVPPGLRSVLFGNVTLEQLISVSGRGEFVYAAELAHNVLKMVCIDPENGLMPDLNRHPNPLRGNSRRLLSLMKKLKATEVVYHKELLLAIVRGRPLLGSLYLDEFPYSIEDVASDNWFPAISLAADVVSSVSVGYGFVDTHAPDSEDVQNIIKCIRPRPFSRSIITKGLLHADSLVKHGTLKLVTEVLQLFDYLVKTLDTFYTDHQMRGWGALKEEIQNGVRMLLPDPQVLLSLLSPLSSHVKSLEFASKRKAEAEIVPEHCGNPSKRLKSSHASEDLDLVISGVNSSGMDLLEEGEDVDSDGEQPLENGADIDQCVRDIWGLSQCSASQTNIKDVDTFFYAKILDSLKIYYRNMPTAMERSVDFFKLIPNNPLALPTILQQSLLQLLNEHVGQISKDVTPVTSPPQMYRHLHPFLVLLVGSPLKQIKEQAYTLAEAAILSTGAFDKNIKEICAWFFFIPGYTDHFLGEPDVQILQELSSVIVSFLCDAVSTTGNNLYKYMESLKHYIYDAEGGKDLSPEVSPFIICVLEKCLRLLSSESGSFTLPQKSLISLYVSNTIKYLLDTQVKAEALSGLVNHILSEKLENSNVDVVEFAECPCEWRPLKTLLRFARDILHQRCYGINSNVKDIERPDSSFVKTLADIEDVLKTEYHAGLVGLSVGFSFSLMCTRRDDLLQNFPIVLSISSNLSEVPFSVLSFILFLEPSYLDDVIELWPELFAAALDNVENCEDKRESLYKAYHDSVGASSFALTRYLKIVPFYVLFSSIAQSCSLHLVERPRLQKLLLDKVTGIAPDHLISSLCNVLFWINHTRSCDGLRSLEELEILSETCFMLAEHLLRQLLIENVDTVISAHDKEPLQLHCVADVAEIIYTNPALTASLNCSLSGDNVLSDSVFGETMEKLLELAREGICRMDVNVLNLLRTTSELLFVGHGGKISAQVINGRKRISRAFNLLKEKLFVIFKSRFDTCVKSMDFKPFLPTFYALHSFISFISPSELLELVNWSFSQIDINDATLHMPSKRSALFICLHLASCTFDFLSEHMRQPYLENKPYSFSGGTETHFDVLLFERIFFQLLQVGSHLKLDIADACLLKAFNVVKMHKGIHHSHLPSVMVLQRVVATIPISIFSYCLQKINRTRADLVYDIVAMSPLHMSVFGSILSEILDKSLPPASVMLGTSKHCFSDEELLMVLPTVLLYLNLVIPKFGGQLCKAFEAICLAYGPVLLSSFSKWKSFVAERIFEIGFDDLIVSKEEYSNLFSCSLLGKTIQMVRDHLILGENGIGIDRRLDLYNSICPSTTDHIVDDFCGKTGGRSLMKSLDFVNRVVAKINLCRVLLFTEHTQIKTQVDNGEKEVDFPKVTFNMATSQIHFLKMLINSWILIVKKFQEKIDYIGNADGDKLPVIRFLEVFVMNNVLELTTDMHDSLIELDSHPFIEQLVKSFLLYRFGDPVTLKMLRTILANISHWKFSCASSIQLLLAHSQFANSIHVACQSFASSKFGLVFTPMQSILRLFFVGRGGPDTLDCKNNELKDRETLHLLELVKFVRVLLHIYAQQREVNFTEDTGINGQELIHLLLLVYGATCSEVDLEIYNLLLDIESNDESCAGTVAQTDYLWGIASLKARKDLEHDRVTQSADQNNIEVYERRKVKFRENIPIDPKICAQTVLFFPYNRVVYGGNSLKLQKASSVVVHEGPSTTVQIYDPVFILRFSIHCLVMSYIEPIEFASLGLLAVTFASISSPDDDMRKLGYESLVKFKSALEKCQKKKEVVRLRLLLTYLQNGIEEPWQRIPSAIAVFAAEASVILLDPSNNNYSTISKHLSNSPSMNMKVIPLFRNFFWSTSVTFKADRVWMLRLLCAGLNTEDDAQTYIRNSIFETLISFYTSPLSDNESKELIIQVVKKAVLLHKAVWFLVEHCGVISWLSSILPFLYGSGFDDQRKFVLAQLPIILEVVSCITSPRNIVEWLQKHAMEQLSELALHLYKILVSGVELITDQSSICVSILQILALVLKMSQKRKIYQPHFTLSGEGLFQLHEPVEACSKSIYNPIMGLGLKVVLMSTPPVTILQMDQEKLLKFLRWAVTTALQSKLEELDTAEDSDHHLIAVSGKRQPEESLDSKLLRWLTASAILGKIALNSRKLNDGSVLEKSSLHALQSWLECPEIEIKETVEYGREEILATTIIHLLKQLNFSHQLLPSSVSALCLLLLSDSSTGLKSLNGVRSCLPSLCSKIQWPVEAIPAWRWSYYHPWRDLTTKLSDVEKLDEIHACERLVVVASNVVTEKSGCSHFFDLKDVDKLRVHEWERTLIHSE
ncbi:diphosphoinositol-polyphosphate diphosphatase [Salvia divinorum]|uniref:Diphosphoinositol-polyphosphate diphosphatase n=1 Tax=Salvia divinorum TaxID=28513 RepID=A0ABD1HCH1_SALDI